MKEKIFEMSEYGPFKAKVDERFHKSGHDCPDDGWVTGYLLRDLHKGEVLPHIFNCPCTWVVKEETIEPVGFHIAQWIKVEDKLPEEGKWVLISQQSVNVGIGIYCRGKWYDDMDSLIDVPPTHWMLIPEIKED